MTACLERRPAQEDGLTVLYDGACPLCSREIAWYRRQAAAERIDWIDLSRCEEDALPAGVRREQALQRFHVIQANGLQVTGAAAFARLWACYPGLRPIARLARLPGIAHVMELGYRAFLRLRPGVAHMIPPPQGDGS